MIRAVICILVVSCAVSLSAADPLTDLEQRLAQASASGGRSSSVMRSLLDNVRLLNERLGDFDKLPQSYQENLQALTEQLRDVDFSQPPNEEEQEFLSEIDLDFRTKAEFLTFGQFATDFARAETRSIHLVVNADGSVFAGGRGVNAYTKNGELLWSTEPDDFVWSLASGRSFVIASSSNEVQKFDVRTGRGRPRMFVGDGPFNSVAASADGKYAWIGALRGPLVKWDLANSNRLEELDLNGGQPTAVKVAPEGNSLLAATMKDGVFLFDADTGKQRQAWSNERLRTKFVSDLAYLPSNSRAVVLGVEGGLSHVTFEGERADPEARQFIGPVPDFRWSCLDVSPSGEWIAAGGKRSSGQDEPLFDPLRPFPDPRREALKDDGGLIRLVRAEDQSPFTLFAPSQVLDVAFAPDNQTLYSSHADGTIRMLATNAATKSGVATTTLVHVTTFQQMQKKDRFALFYVPKALLNKPNFYRQFDRKSHTSNDFPPGRFWLWGGQPQPNQLKKPVEINTSTPRQLDLDVP